MKKLITLVIVLVTIIASYLAGINAGMKKFFNADEVCVEGNEVVFVIEGNEYIFVYEEV